MKPLIIILLLVVPTFAQYRLPADTHTYLVSRSRALAIYNGEQLQSGDLRLWEEGVTQASADDVAIVLRGRFTRPALLDAIEMTGLVAGRRVVPETCFGSKSQDCSVSHTPTKVN